MYTDTKNPVTKMQEKIQAKTPYNNQAEIKEIP